MKTTLRLVLGLFPLLDTQCGVDGNSLENSKQPDPAGIHLGIASAPPPVGALVWKDANGKTVGFYTLVANYYQQLAISSFMDDDGIIWGINPGDATVSPLRQLTHWYTTRDCTGANYWMISLGAPQDSALPRWSLVKPGTTTDPYVTLRDKAVPQSRLLQSSKTGTTCKSNILPFAVYSDSDFRVVTLPSATYTAPLHVEQQL